MAAALVALVVGLLVPLQAGRADAAPVTQPLVVALCHGNNQSWPVNFDKSHFVDMFSETGGSETIADYWRDVSQDHFSIAGTRVLDVQLDMNRDAIGDRDQNDFSKCRDGVNDNYSIDWDKFAGPVVIKPQTEGRTVNAIDETDTTLQVRAEGPSVMADWPSAPFTLVLTKTGTLWKNKKVNVENVKVTAVSLDDPEPGVATFTIEREQTGYRQHDPSDVAPPAKAWPAGTIVKDIADTYGSKNRTAVVKADAHPSVTNQEMGHFFGFSHSRKLSTATKGYGDCFDVMSTRTCPSHYFTVPFDYPASAAYSAGVYDQFNGPGMVSPYLDLKGWIDGADRTTFSPATSCEQQTFSMRALGLGGSALEQIRVPVNTSIRSGVASDYLTVELRSQQFTWDQGIPHDAFVLHLKGDDDLAYLIDDAGAGGTRGMDAGDFYVFDDGASDWFFFVNGINGDGTGQITLANCPFTSEMTYTGPTAFTYNTSPEVTASFQLDNGKAAPGGDVTFTLDGSDCSDRIYFSAQEDGTGEAACDLDIDMQPGTYDLTARWDGITDASGATVFEPAETTVAVAVNKRRTVLELDPTVDTAYHDPVTLRATLHEVVDADDPTYVGYHAVQDRDVELSIGAGGDAQSCTATTDRYGDASCMIGSAEQTPGTVPVHATFVGDDYYLPSSDDTTFTVLRRATVLTFDAPDFTADAGPIELTGTLVEADTDLSDGAPVSGRTVTFTLGDGDDAQSCDATTGPSGEASCTIDIVDQPLGPHPISAAFAGDDYYLPSSDDDEMIVFAWTEGGHFVVGDGSAVTDATVTYWSSEWYLDNTVSGGQAPDSFKGFANSPVGGTDCGTASWTSYGGNSTDVADHVPEYTAMLVTDAVAKHGRDMEGSTTAVAVVRVDPGYQTDPGHPSTATVLGLLCIN